MIELKSDRLLVQIDEPDEGRNSTVRFDRAGYITRVQLDGKHEFCTVEPDNLSHPCSGGAGLCSEIKDNLWADTPVGGKAPKFGVGLLTKPDEGRYQFFAKYETEHFPMNIESDGRTAVFTTGAIPCMGYALKQKKTVAVEGNTITVTYFYENVGEKALSLGEYVHNFVTIDRLPIGPDYCLYMPTIAPQDGKKAKQETGTIYGKGSGFTYSAYNPAAAMIDVDGSEIAQDKPFSWKLTNANTTASVSEEDSFIPTRIPVWTIDHIASAEVYTNFDLAPGETHTYTRKWVFED